MFLNSNPNASNPSDHLPMLKDSISMFLAQYSRGVDDFSDIGDVFLRSMPELLYAQLEIVWFYLAMRFHTAVKSSAQDPSRRLSATKDLFQLLVSKSPSVSDLKKIAVLAPVVYELCHLARERKELSNDIRVFLEEGVVKYIGLFFILKPKEEGGKESLSSFFADLVRVWTVDRSGEGMRVFFPMVSDQARDRIGLGCEVGCVAGLVMVEAFLLLLSLKFGPGSSREDMHYWAVQTITDLQSFYFIDALLRMLSEPVLPVTFLLSSEDEVVIREVLYDAVGRVEYSFLIPLNRVQLLPKHLKHLTMSWLFVAYKALLSMRGDIDKTKLTCFIEAFKSSCLTSYLVNWVLNQAGIGRNMNTLVDSFQTPTTIINLIRSGEVQGVAFFDKEDSKNPCYSLFQYLKKKSGEEANPDDADMVDSVENNTLQAIPGTMYETPNETRKRKEGREVEEEAHPKFGRHDLLETLKRQRPFHWVQDEALSSGSEVDNPVTDDDVEDMEQ